MSFGNTDPIAKPAKPAAKPSPVDATDQSVRDAGRNARKQENTNYNRQDTDLLTGVLSSDPDKLRKKELLGG